MTVSVHNKKCTEIVSQHKLKCNFQTSFLNLQIKIYVYTVIAIVMKVW